MSDNIIHQGDSTIILNGGDPLPGCPENFDQAHAIEALFNADSPDEDPVWKFDCGFKLDYDGDILTIGSRFYPPKTHYGPTWDGKMSIYLFGEKILEKHFDCATLEELKERVQEHYNLLKEGFKTAITTALCTS